MRNQFFITIGVLAGIILVKMLYPVIGRFTDSMGSNKVTEEQVQTYIDRSKPMQLQYSSYRHDYATYSNLMHTKHLLKSYYLFYDNTYKKYFSIQMFDPFAIDGLLDDVKNTSIRCFINTDQLNNPVYGTEKNPVPILRCDIVIKDEWKESDVYAIMGYKKFTNDYKNIVYNNLKYFTPKEEFQKMFPDQK